MMKLWYHLQYAHHMMEAYLAEQRHDYVTAAIEKNAAYECERKILLEEIQK